MSEGWTRARARSIALVDLAFDVAELGLHECRGVADALVVDGRAQLADEEVEQRLGAERAQRLVEFRGVPGGERPEQRGAALRGQPHFHGRRARSGGHAHSLVDTAHWWAL